MHSVSDLWRQLVGTARRKVSVVISGTNYRQEYDESEISSAFVSGRTFDAPSVGNATARQLDITFLPKKDENGAVIEIPRMAKIEVYVSLVSERAATESIKKGVFFIDTRSTDTTSGWMTAQCFDCALLMEQALAQSESESIPYTTTGLMNLIAGKIGAEIDNRSVMPPYMLEDEMDDRRAKYMTMRQVAGYVAGLYGGNWIVTDEGKLYLLPLAKSPAEGETAIAVNASNAAGIYVSPALPAWSGVKFTYKGKTIASAGDESGRVMEIENPWASATIAANLLKSVNSLAYYPYEATDAVIDPAVEMGDFVSVDGATRRIFAMSGSLDGLCAVDVSAPAERDIDHEFPRSEALKKADERAVEDALEDWTDDLNDPERKPGDNTSADKLDEYTDGRIEGALEDVRLIGDTSVAPDGVVTNTVELNVGGESHGKAQFIISGSLSVSGQISADALYVTYGDFANLTVDKLLTSRRIVKRLAHDTTDDNYQWISGEVHQFIAGLYAGGEEQATNPNGELIYWSYDPAAEDVSIGVNGYPFRGGVQIEITTTQTQWPVMVYTYTEQVKAEFSFELERAADAETGMDAIYTPTITLGGGNASGYNQGLIRKGTDGLRVAYSANTGDIIGMKCRNDGYTELSGFIQIVGSEEDLPEGHASMDTLFIIAGEESGE